MGRGLELRPDGKYRVYDEEYKRICTWIQQLNGEYENKGVTHSQLLEEAREIGVAVLGLCAGVIIKNGR